MKLPQARGPLSEALVHALSGAPGRLDAPGSIADDPLAGDDFHLALYVAYELHYRSFDEVDDAWEWHPSLIAFRGVLERAFEQRVREETGETSCPPDDVAARLWDILERAPDDMSRYIERDATLDQLREFVVHRSAYHLKEADPHTWGLPRLAGRPKAAMVEIQMDEYGSGMEERAHSYMFASTMAALDLDPTYGAYLDSLPGATLATVNLMSLFGLHRRLRAAIVGHLAAFEMSSSGPNRRYANGVRRLGRDAAAPFFDEHVEADSLHEQIAANDLAAAFARAEPERASEVLFGAAALLTVDRLWSDHVLGAWRRGESSLLLADAFSTPS